MHEALCLCLGKWNKEVFGNILEENNKLEQEMEAIQQKGIQGIFSSDLIVREVEILWNYKDRIH